MPATKIDRSAGRHECPICHHTCWLTPPAVDPKPPGRPCERPYQLVSTLMEEASSDLPMPLYMIAKRLGLEESNVRQLIYRVRKQYPQFRIGNVPRLGYYAQMAE